MRNEIWAAVRFLARFVSRNKCVSRQTIEDFKCHLLKILMGRYEKHWFPDTPCKGQAFRCIRVNRIQRTDPTIAEAAEYCHLSYEDIMLPFEFTMWIDPGDVSCRFGEHKGLYCTIASFKGENQLIYVDDINIEEMVKKSFERMTQAQMDIMNGLKKVPQKAILKNLKPYKVPIYPLKQLHRQILFSPKSIQVQPKLPIKQPPKCSKVYHNCSQIRAQITYRKIIHRHYLSQPLCRSKREPYQWLNKSLTKL